MKIKVSQLRKSKATYTELARVRESVTITCISAETRRQAEEWGNFRVDKRDEREDFRCALEAVGLRKPEAGCLETGSSTWLVRGTYLAFSTWL